VSRVRSQAGFTLVETLVAMVMAGVVLGATLTALEVFQRTNAADIKRNEQQDNVRNAIDSMTRQLLNVVAPNPESAATLEEAEPYSITFRTVNSAEDKKMLRVRYCLNTATRVLWYQSKTWVSTENPNPVSAPSGTTCPDVSKSDWEQTRQLATNVTDFAIGKKLFEYGPPGASVSSKITSVVPRIFQEINPGKEPAKRSSSRQSRCETQTAARSPPAAPKKSTGTCCWTPRHPKIPTASP
jgi:prepilin-type N-terminal cleavage/methylation domain-containing protein